MSTAALRSLIEQVRAAAATGRSLRIRAGGSKDFYGNTPRGEVLDPRSHAGIVSHEPSELVITARCGTPLAEVEAALQACGQMLGFEPPNHAGQATLGGCVAAGLAGPARMAAGFRYGGVRDSILGAMLLDGRGELLRFGGTVLKNVAGYDIGRLLAGSLGALGVIADVSLKVLPLPAASATLQFDVSETEALRAVSSWRARPLPVTATSWHNGSLHVRLEGADAAVRTASRALGGMALAPAAAQSWWRQLRHQTHPLFADPAPVWRMSLPVNAPALALEGAQLIEWSGMQRWLRSGGSAAALQSRAAALGGHATLYRRGAGAAGARSVFAPLAPATLALHRRLRSVFDPHGVFDFGRLVAEA